jgi:NAD-dependent protein deacetylases, SIR2 family
MHYYTIIGFPTAKINIYRLAIPSGDMAISEEMELKEILKQVGLDQLKEGSLCIFAGAGLSINSGIPRASKIIEYVMDQIFDDKLDKSLILSPLNKMPFEAYLEILFRNYIPSPYCVSEKNKIKQMLTAVARILVRKSDDYTFLHNQFFNLFDSEQYEPNSNHYFIAEMLKKGVCSFAVTTNFDLMIEKAYKKITEKELRVYFPKPDQKIKYEFPCLLKLHGGCQEIGTIQTTLDRIANKGAVTECEAMVDYTFHSGGHSTIMVMGYSFSDVFDVNPAIGGICESKKEVVIIKHSDGQPSLSSIWSGRSFFQNFNGWQVNADTNTVIDVLKELYPPEKPWTKPFSSTKKPGDINKLLRNWAVRLKEPHQKMLLCGVFMEAMNRPIRAEFYFNRCLETA